MLYEDDIITGVDVVFGCQCVIVLPLSHIV